MVTYNPSSVDVIVPYLQFQINGSSGNQTVSVGDNVELKLISGLTGCVDFSYNVNGGAFSTIGGGINTCPYSPTVVNDTGVTTITFGIAWSGTMQFYATYNGTKSNVVTLTVTEPTITLSVTPTSGKQGTEFQFTAGVIGADGIGISNIDVQFEDLSTGAKPSGSLTKTGSSGYTYFNYSMGCNTCFIGVPCSYTWIAYATVGAYKVIVKSNTVKVSVTC